VVRGDIRERDVLERALGEYEIDTVIHLAAQTIVTIANRNPISTFETNIAGTWNVLEACRRSPRVRQVVIASSDKAYGDQEILPYDENTPLQGQHPYDVSKSAADLIAYSYAKSFDLPVAITRCGNLRRWFELNRIIPGTIRSILRTTSDYSLGWGIHRDYFYVEDGAAVYMWLAEQLAALTLLKGRLIIFQRDSGIGARDRGSHPERDEFWPGPIRNEVRMRSTSISQHNFLY
jgi:CDP-glucose 4,6-dehydratase